MPDPAKFMISGRPRTIAFVDASLITVVASAMYALIMVVFHYPDFHLLLLIAPAVFVVSYLVILYSINKFIYEKIIIIYRTIGKLKTKSNEDEKLEKYSGDVLEIVNQAVLEWSEEQKQKIAELRKMADYRREFIGNVSHELKTPIFNIQGYILTLLDGGLKDDKINMKFLKNAKKSVNRMIAIVEDLEEISKFEAGELKLKTGIFDLNELVKDVVDYMEMKAADYRSTLTIDTPPDKVLLVEADKKRIRQVLINLIDNAIKYGDKQHSKVNIAVFDFHDYYLVEIADNGIGIPEEYLFRVFERFFRTDKARARETGGSGLGLAIVKHIIEAHNQKISVRNNPGKGSTFSFTLKKV